MDRIRGSLWLGLALLAVVETAWLGAFEWVDHRLQDTLLRRHALARTPDPEVVLVSIDERSLDAMAAGFGRFPWPRSVLAEMVARLNRHGARAIVVDVVIAEPDVDRPADDDYFIETAVATPNAYFPMVRLENADDAQGLDLDQWGERLGFTRTPGAAPGARIAMLLPFRPIAETGRIGLINFLTDADGIGRRYQGWLEHEGWRIPSLAIKVASAIGIEAPAGDSLEIHWRGEAEARRHISFSDLFSDLSRETPQQFADDIRGRIVVIGATAAGLTDIRRTPLSGEHPGPDILAAAIETLKNGDALRRLPPAAGAVFALLAIGLVFLLSRTRLGVAPLGGMLLLLTPLAALASYAALSRNWMVPWFTPMAFAWLAYLAHAGREYLRERAARREAVKAFGRFVDPRVVETLVASGGDPRQPAGQSRVISILFSDIRGFTTLSESRAPEEVVELLNRYFSLQVEVIFRHRGTVDKFIGDAIMAFWNAPVDDPDHAANAVRAALEMGAVVDRFRAELPGPLATEFDIGIGVHTGPAVVGFIGSENKLEYTAIGDSVNLASRIEGATKGVARVLVSEATRDACGAAFEFTDRGGFKAKGKSHEVRLYEPAARR